MRVLLNIVSRHRGACYCSAPVPLLQMFIRAKKAPRCPWQVFVASALMEWRHSREKDVARKIFEKGLETTDFANVPEYVLAYATFLCGEWHWGLGSAMWSGFCYVLVSLALTNSGEAACTP